MEVNHQRAPCGLYALKTVDNCCSLNNKQATLIAEKVRKAITIRLQKLCLGVLSCFASCTVRWRLFAAVSNSNDDDDDDDDGGGGAW